MTPGACDACGAELREGARFCPACGTACSAPASERPGGDAVGTRRAGRGRIATAVLTALVIAAAAVVVFELTSSSGSSSTERRLASPTVTGRQPPSAATGSEATDLPCDEGEAKAQLDHGPFADAIRRELDIPSSSNLDDEFLPKLVACADLTGDGENEMVVEAVGPTGGSPNPWAIFTPNDGEWSLAIARVTGPVETLTVVDNAIREVLPTYRADDPLCCPSGTRSGYVRWNGSGFEYVSDLGASGNRAIHLAANGMIEKLGDLALQSADLHDVRTLLGTPSTVGAGDRTSCSASWTDLGLYVYFENLGGNGACGSAGRIGRIEIRGEPGAQAGWVVDDGVRIGTPVEEALQLYPKAYAEHTTSEEACPGSLYVLRTAPVAGTLPTLLVHAQGGKVSCMELDVFAAGI